MKISIKKGYYCIEKLDVVLCRRPARLTKEDLDAIINAFKNKQMFTTHSKQSFTKRLQFLNMTKYFGKTKIFVKQ